MFHHFMLMPFLIGLGIGIVVFFFLKPEAKDRVVKWPHPSNVGKITYRDRNGLCYKFKDQIVDCSSVKGTVKEYAFE